MNGSDVLNLNSLNHGALDMQYMGQRVANDATFRRQVGNAVTYMNWCTANPSACNKDQLQKAMGLGVLVLGPVMAANPQLVMATEVRHHFAKNPLSPT